MALLDMLQSIGSSLGLGGATPGNTPPTDDSGQRYFNGSSLDLDGQTPTKYSNTAPEGQGGRV